MFDFRHWLFFNEVISDTYESASSHLGAIATANAIVEFYNEAVLGSSPTILEDSSGEETPAEMTEKEASWRVKSTAWKVRWAAMLDRLEAVEKVKKVYEDEWLPLMQERTQEIRAEYDRAAEKFSSDEEARREVGRKFGMSTYEVGRLLGDPHNEWVVLEEEEEDDWDVPTFDDEDEVEPKKSFEERLQKIVDSIEPVLVKLGYLKAGRLEEEGPYKKQEVLGDAIVAASKETGNEPPANDTTKELRRNPAARASARTEFANIINSRFSRMADSTYRKLSVRLPSGKRGSRDFQDKNDILSNTIVGLLSSLGTRSPNGEWNSDLKVLSADPKNPNEILGSVGARMTQYTAARDERRQSKRAAGMSGDQEGSPQYLGAGAMQDDGSQASIDVSDASSTDSLSQSVRTEFRDSVLDGFKKAMADLKAHDPFFAVLACVWLDLNCSRDGSMPAVSASKILSVSIKDPASGIQTTRAYLNKLGLAASARSADEADWEFVKRIKDQNIVGVTRVKAIPPGEISRSDPTWQKYMAALRDVKGDAIEELGKLWAAAMIQQSTDPALGQENSISWNAGRFLRIAYGQKIRAGLVRVQAQGSPEGEQNIKIEFWGDRNTLSRSYDMLVQYKSNHISFFQEHPEGFESNDFDFEIPAAINCPACNGRGRGCEECEGRGRVMNSKALIELERNILDRLARNQRKVKSKTQA